MEDILINFNTAKLAKEKGFNILTEKMYRQDGMLGNSDFSRESTFRAPTQSLLQKWLREVHNIYIKIFPEDDSCNNRIWDISLFELNYGQDKEVHYLSSNGYKKTYEEALEIGLQEALKLI